jgi:hypothetical protein
VTAPRALRNGSLPVEGPQPGPPEGSPGERRGTAPGGIAFFLGGASLVAVLPSRGHDLGHPLGSVSLQLALPMPRAAFIQADDASVAFQATAGGTVPISVAARHIFTGRHWIVAHLHRGIPLVLPAAPTRRGAFIQLATPAVGATHAVGRLTGRPATFSRMILDDGI